MLQKLGKQTAFIGKVGDDMFGRQLTEAVSSVGVDTRALLVDKEVHTTLAFVHTYPDGDRDFSFYRNPGADMMLTKDDVDEDLIQFFQNFPLLEHFPPHMKVYEKQPDMLLRLPEKPET